MALLPNSDQLVSLLWRLPGWGPLAMAVRAAGKVLKFQNQAPPLVVPPGVLPLDRLPQKAKKGFWAGAAAVEITPPRPEGIYLAGFDANRTCTGVRDPLFARALVLSDGKVPLLIVALDLIGLSLVRARRLRQLLTAHHPNSVVIASTHNHQSPDTLGLWGKALGGLLPYRTGLDPAYLAWLEERIAVCVAEAVAAAKPANLYLGAQVFDPEGRWVHNERSQVIDRSMRVLHLATDGGDGIATLVQHACHPETLWRSNRLISADFCGRCCRQVEEQLGGVGIYLNGALGAMVTAAIGWETPEEQRQEVLEGLGEAMGLAAVSLVRRIRKRPANNPRIAVAQREVSFPIQDNRLYALIHALGVVEDRDLSGGLLSEVFLARVGKASITGLPGEPAPELAQEILKQVDGSPKFLFGLANDELGYLIPPAFFQDRRYAYERTMSPGPEAETQMIEALLALDGELQQDLRHKNATKGGIP